MAYALEAYKDSECEGFPRIHQKCCKGKFNYTVYFTINYNFKLGLLELHMRSFIFVVNTSQIATFQNQLQKNQWDQCKNVVE